jgi:glycosyltransferase involved in cell wall biosynthesis
MAAVDQLKEKGLPVELVLLENVPAEKMRSLYESCDIVVDQVLYGWYGKVSIEAMALGLPAVCFIDPQWLPYRPDMPIVNADPSSLVGKLTELVGSSSLRSRLGQAGIEYAHKHHDIKSIVDQCLGIYLDSFQA